MASEAEEAFAVIRDIRSAIDQQSILRSHHNLIGRLMEILDGTDIGTIGGRRVAKPELSSPMPGAEPAPEPLAGNPGLWPCKCGRQQMRCSCYMTGCEDGYRNAVACAAPSSGAPLVASATCPICGVDEPHPHYREAIEQWVSNQVAAWGYKARLAPLAGPDPIDDLMRRTAGVIEGLNEAQHNWVRAYGWDRPEIEDIKDVFCLLSERCRETVEACAKLVDDFALTHPHDGDCEGLERRAVQRAAEAIRQSSPFTRPAEEKSR